MRADVTGIAYNSGIRMHSEGYADFAAFRNYIQTLIPQLEVKLVVEHSANC